MKEVTHFPAPQTVQPKTCSIRLALMNADYHVQAENRFEFLLLPPCEPGAGRIFAGGDAACDGTFRSVLQARGWSFTESPEQCDVALCSRFDARMHLFFKRGGRGVFLFERPEDFPAGLHMRLSRASSSSGFLWLRSDSAVFSGLTERWVPARAWRSLAAPYFIDGIGGSNFRDVLAGYLVAEEEFFQPVMVMFRLGHGSGIMCTFPLRRLCAEGDRSALFLLEAVLRSLRSGALPMPRFEPAVSEREFLVPLSRDGSALWRLSFQKPAGLWYGKAFKDRSWKRSRG